MIYSIPESLEDISQASTNTDDIGSSRWHTILRKMSIKSTPENGVLGIEEKSPEVLMIETTLPTVQECISEEKSDQTTSYFEHPFEPNDSVIVHSQTSTPLSTTPCGDDDNTKPKMQWKMSFEKTKTANHMRVQTAIGTDMISKLSLAPYYPPAVLPPYLSLLFKDERGRKPADITDSIIDQNGTHRLWTFRIELRYGEIKWAVSRTVIEFYNLYLTLKFKHISGLISDPPPSFPSQLALLTNAALTSMRISREEDDDNWRDIALKRRDELQTYLKELIERSSTNANYELCEFLELSAISIVKDMGWKGKEGYLEYCTTPESFQINIPWQRLWKKEWFILRDSYILFCKDVESNSATDVFLFDKHFHITKKPQGNTAFGSVHLVLSNSTQSIEIKGSQSKHMDEWIENFDKVQKESPWVMNHRFGSFAPIREKSKAKWFVDAHDYYEAVIQAILSAKSEIFIEDWWLYLRRPPKGNEEYRLDRLLKRKAAEGVMIYIVLYKNVTVALPLDSNYTRDWMQNVHPNILVQRHSNLANSPFWAHHEKILVIDYRLAFIGGLDLCFGRYDTSCHSLTDYTCRDEDREVFPGQDYSNPRIKDFYKVSQYNTELIEKSIAARMPWHDIHTAMVGLPARDAARHFVQRWNFIKLTKHKEKTAFPFLQPKGEYIAFSDEEKFKGSCRVQVLRSSAEWSLGIKREYSIYSAYMECIFKAKYFIYIENQFFITTTNPDDKLIKNKIGQAIVERIKRAHKEKQKFRVIVVIPTAPGFEGDFSQPDRRSMPLRSVAQYQYRSISYGKNSVFEQLRAANIPIQQYIGFYSLRGWGKIKKMPSSPTTHLDEKRKKRVKSKTNTNCDEAIKEMPPSIFLDDGRMDYVTEQIYIHSKLMIIDDRIVICGSANLNDRSQLGNRDSEIAVIIEDEDFVESKMNGQPYRASKYALTLRSQLFREHLGLDVIHKLEKPKSDLKKDSSIMDPLDDDFYFSLWSKTAEKNTLIYRDLFKCVPDDTVYSIEDHRKFVPDSTRIMPGHIAEPWKRSAIEIQRNLDQIQGHLVQFPTDYMKSVNMTASVMQEAVPPIVFT